MARMDAGAMTESVKRCGWPGEDPLYLSYHDEEWGVPEWDDRALLEKLILDGFQAGLAWITVLRKREAFRAAFDGFDPERIARYGEPKIRSLLNNSGIIRHRGKIEGAIGNARSWLAMMEGGRGFSSFVWGFVDGAPQVKRRRSASCVPAQTAMSRSLSRSLGEKGFRYCGPTIVYAWAQAVGMVNDHLERCFRREACMALAEKAVAEQAVIRHNGGSPAGIRESDR